MMRGAAIVLLTLFSPAVAGAGLFDDFVNKAKEVTEEAIGKTVGAVEDGENESHTSSAEEVSPQDPATGQQQQITQGGSGAAEPTRKALMLACLKYVPEILDDEEILKTYVNRIYPEEAGITYNNEFKWRKRRDEFRQRILAEAESAPSTFEYAPWSAAPRITVYAYDFDREAFRVGRNKVHVGLPPYARANWNDPRSLEWLHMPPDKAETVANRYRTETRYLYAHYTVEILDADYRSMDPRRPDNKVCSPKVDVEAFELYLPKDGSSLIQVGTTRSDYEHLMSLNVAQ